MFSDVTNRPMKVDNSFQWVSPGQSAFDGTFTEAGGTRATGHCCSEEPQKKTRRKKPLPAVDNGCCYGGGLIRTGRHSVENFSVETFVPLCSQIVLERVLLNTAVRDG